jgi:hypothetical protein
MSASRVTGHLKLIERDEGGRPTPLTGQQVLLLCSELIAEHLPTIPFDDPDRGRLVALGLSVPRSATPPELRRRIR